MKYHVQVYATPEGSLHMNNSEHRSYIVEADTPENARLEAIKAAYKEGGIEHINPRKVTAIGAAIRTTLEG